jgi:predicted Fe-Mo cluster-binding NifX family protein
MGKNALMIACENDEISVKTLTKIVRQLVTAGVDIMARNQQGQTALDILKKRFINSPSSLVTFVKILG